ncbi:MAG: RadC family protein [Clostridia bacterium]|nr:RadC family protein [Clostridia bacterium]
MTKEKNPDGNKIKRNVHADHRERTKERFRAEGLEHFQPHNVLELLLFYSIPQRDTNEIAHALIDKFGSLAGVFDASYDELITVPGISTHSATLIKLMPELFRKYASEKSKTTTKFATLADLGNFFVRKYIGVTVETVFLLLIDNKRNMIDCVKVYEGSVNSAKLDPRRLAELALFKRASSVVLAHNHPGGVALPSSDDIHTTIEIQKIFSLLGISLDAHIIVADNSYIDILKRV